MPLTAYAKHIAISATLGLAVIGQVGSANAESRNTYNGAECEAVFPNQAQNLRRFFGVTASARTEVLCPIVKTLFSSEDPIDVSVAASQGTVCRLESYDVFDLDIIPSRTRTFLKPSVSGLNFRIEESHRGALQLRCTLQAGDEIRNYLAHEE